MSDNTPIEWADDSTSPWWGCTRHSPGCTHCYAETMASRFGRGSWGPSGVRALRVDACLADLDRFARRGIREGRPRRVFLGSMCDVFEEHCDLDEPRKRLWDGLHSLSMRLGSGIHVLVLTKRAEEMAAWSREYGWPAACWAGVSVEDQRRADERIPHLLTVPALVRFISAEPLLGAVDLDHLDDGHTFWTRPVEHVENAVDWVIAGGESGPHARPMHPDWARSLRDQCVSAGVPFFFKQWGEFVHTSDIASWAGCDKPVADYPHVADGSRGIWLRVGKKAAGCLLDGRTWDEIPEVTR